ncbi:ArnT family glycosyltransferase [Oleiharenicola lentus]|uniref:ArnT family glycosyltransferase n=1 Tax=Oleiharenicola lentus TaxID=2508720 RepID=UPI003F679FA7
MLKLLFDWFDTHPSSYWIIVSGPTLLLLLWAAWPLRAELSQRTGVRENRFWGACMLFAFLLAWRWPWLLSAHQYSPDESQHVAGILTLAEDPVFFRSVDASTSGPLNFYLPLPLVFLLGKIDFFTVRLAGLLMVWGMLFFSYRAAVQLAGVMLARIGLMSAAFFFATTTDWEFLHYSTEHAPLLLWCVCLWALVHASLSAQPIPWLVCAGFAAGLSPWAKLQIGPLSAALIILGLWQIATGSSSRKTKQRQALILAGSTLIPTFAALLLLMPFKLAELAWQRYVLQTFVYVEDAERTFETAWLLGKLAWGSGWLPAFVAGPLLVALLAAIFALGQRRSLSGQYLACGALVAVSVISIIFSGRAFQHYLLLSVIPIMLWGITATKELWLQLAVSRSRPALLIGFWTLAITPLAILRLSQPVPSMFGLFAEQWRNPRTVVNDLIHSFSQPGDRLALWGYAPQVYAETGLAQGTRDSDTYWSITPSETRDIYRAVYLEDLKQNQPAIFVDSVGPGSIYYSNPERDGHQSFPELAAYIAANYTHVVDRSHYHIHVRRDLFSARSEKNPRFQSALLRAQQQPLRNISSENIVMSKGRFEKLGNGSVVLLLPPASLSFKLEGHERELLLNYGFHPRAIAAWASDGATLSVEIHTPGHPPQPVFKHFLDPGSTPGARVPHSIRIPIPPFPADSQLILSTDAGPSKSSAWDWIYISSFEFQRSEKFLPSQFPAFNRLPEKTSASTAYYLGEPDAPLLMQHAPAKNIFRLNGKERTLAFAFGFNEGAYTAAGKTNGAIFRVERHRKHVEPVVLFARRLNPLDNPADRGRQECAIDLPDVQKHDRLKIIVDPMDNHSWDWTYLTSLRID